MQLQNFCNYTEASQITITINIYYVILGNKLAFISNYYVILGNKLAYICDF
jgi:hypothetical protein